MRASDAARRAGNTRRPWGFAAAAGAVQIFQATRGSTPPPPCGRDVFVCRGDATRVCTTDQSGCRVCSCVRLGGSSLRPEAADFWH